MSFKRKAVALTALFIIPSHISALQVSPNSPCASVCVDREDFDLSDPKSSNTQPKDITCNDDDYSRSVAGIKWKNCMTCLEKSSFVQGSESDQGWFLYNMRYNFNYCVYGYPNNTQIGSNPCQTSRACGALKEALLDGKADPEKTTEYGYCTADSGSMTGEFYDKCLTCISSSSFKDQVIVRNGLIALGAGCQQRPGPGKILGLNNTIFSLAPIGALNPDAAGDHSDAQGGSTTPTTTMIIGIVAGVLGLAAIAGTVYVCVRKRRENRRRAEEARKGWDAAQGYQFGSGGPGGGGGGGSSGIGPGPQGPQSPLSFRCQTVLSPTAPQPFNFSPVEEYSDDKQQSRQYITSSSSSPSSTWQQRWPNASPVAEYHQGGAGVLVPQSEKAAAMGLYQLTTTALPAVPKNTHQSPQSGLGTMRGSPVSATPTSATQLLPGGGVAMYVPADYAGAIPLHEQQQFSAWQQSNSPPQQYGWPGQQHQQPQQQFPQHRQHQTASPPPPSKSPKVRSQRKGSMEKKTPGLAESLAIQTSFPGPPGRR